ncbi:MAG: ATP-binding cassette domain-containing protein [Chlorobi bacterium]|nr:ATP-binding cassette domain-containing protein [Chlorobiota bacterium]
MKTTLKIQGLSKSFGRIKAVQNLNLSVMPGQVYGILGPNGSGKTTTLGMILEVVTPQNGSFSWFDGMPNIEARKKIGAILETPCFLPYLSATRNLEIVAHIKNTDTKRIDLVLRQLGLFDRKDDKFKTFSLGMKQRLSIGAALLANPPVLILDEPTNGLDPQGIAEVRQLIVDIAKQGKTIIIASHLLDEVQKVCTHFCVLKYGVKIHEGAVSETLGEINKVELKSENMKNLAQLLEKFEGKEKIENGGNTLTMTLKDGYNAMQINEFCFNNGIVLQKLSTHTNSLEKEFLKILKDHD